MSAHSTYEEKKARIDRYTMELIAQQGMENFSIRGVCKGLNMSAPTLYDIYVGKEDLLTSLYSQINKEISQRINQQLDGLPNPESPADVRSFFWKLWNIFWDFLMEDKNRTLFMWRFYTSTFHTMNLDGNPWAGVYMPLRNYMRHLDAQLQISRRADVRVMVEGAYAYTLNAAAQISAGILPTNETTLVTVYRMATLPMMETLGVEKVLTVMEK